MSDELNENNEFETEIDDLKQEDPTIEEKELIDRTNSDGVILPSETFYKITNFINSINSITADMSETKLNKQFTEEELLGIGINFSSQNTTTKADIFVKNINDIDKNWTNIIEFANRELKIREIPFKNSDKKQVYKSGDSISRFLSYLGSGGVIQIPMWHSGFWITLKPVTDSDLINLEYQLANEQIELGRSTNGIVFSNYSVVFVRIVTDFILDHIENTTVKFDDNTDIRDYIKIQDLYPLVLGLITIIYPNGFNNFRTCKNSLILEDNKPKCSYVVEAKIDPKKLLWVNKDDLSNNHKDIMSKRIPNSVTINEMIEYQTTLKTNKSKIIEISLDNGAVLNIELKTPTISEHIDNGIDWINTVIDLVEDTITDDINIGEKNRRINKMSKTSILNIYRHYIDKIEINNSIFKDDAIPPILETIANNETAYKTIKKEIKEYITEYVTAIVAIPNYVCPKCKSEQTPDNIRNVFKEFVPLGVLENFFDLSTFKTNKLIDRELTTNM